MMSESQGSTQPSSTQPSTGAATTVQPGGEVVAGAVFQEITTAEAARDVEDAGLAFPAMDDVRPPQVENYDPSRALDDARWKLARGLLTVLIMVVVLNVALLATTRLTGASAADITGMFETMFAAVVTLVSAATGFYFGARVNLTTTGSGADLPPGQPRTTGRGIFRRRE